MGVYRRPRDARLWVWFQLLCTERKISLSEAATEAIREWVVKNDPDGKWDKA
jgi:hypothetical protein